MAVGLGALLTLRPATVRAAPPATIPYEEAARLGRERQEHDALIKSMQQDMQLKEQERRFKEMSDFSAKLIREDTLRAKLFTGRCREAEALSKKWGMSLGAEALADCYRSLIKEPPRLPPG